MNITYIKNQQEVNDFLLKLHSADLKLSLESSLYMLTQSLNKVRLILSRKNIVAAMSIDKKLDMMLLEKSLEGIVIDLSKAHQDL